MNEQYYIAEAEFVTSAPNLKTCPTPSLPEIAIAGRSNVGKSSLINLICNRKQLAKTSSTPGKTQLINFFRLRIKPGDVSIHMVDLPGYGYAKVSKSVREFWGKEISRLLEKRKAIQGIIQLVDSRYEPTKLDHQMREWIVHSNIPSAIILTKTDKIPTSKIDSTIQQVRSLLVLNEDESCIPSSVIKKQGTAEILSSILTFLGSFDNSSV